MNSNFTILVTGKSTNVEEIKKAFFGYNLIFSCWNGDEQKYQEDDIVLFNDAPIQSGPYHFFYQKTCSLNGLIFCKNKGYDYVLKMRNDLVPTNINEFIKIIDFDKFNFIGKHIGSSQSGPYFIDYFMSGKVDDLIKLWEIEDVRTSDFVEQTVTRRFYSCFSEISVNFILNDLNNQNDLYWIKNNTNISEYKKHDCYKI